jgi:hypothetical protein
MAIVLSEEEKLAVRNGEKTISQIIAERGKEVYQAPKEEEVALTELDKVKQEIRETNIAYKESIQRNKDLYDELKENRKRKEELRNRIAELRVRKKKLLGQA